VPFTPNAAINIESRPNAKRSRSRGALVIWWQCQLLAFGSRLSALGSQLTANPAPSSVQFSAGTKQSGGTGSKGPRTKDHGPIQEWPHAEPLTLGQKQWENTAEAHNKLLIYGSAFGHKKHAVFIVFNQLEKIWQSL